jgi:LCP family protein required for cell wall assembly
LRRGLALVLFDLIAPGSAQIAAGNKHAGRPAFRLWQASVAMVLLLLVVALIAPGFLSMVYFNPITLTILAWGVPIIGIGWGLLLLDAWRIANPRQMSAKGKVFSGSLALVLAFAVTGTSVVAYGFFDGQASFVGDVLQGGGATEVQQGRYNILLLGGDAAGSRPGIRPDSMTVASIDAATGRTVLFSLPRNLQRAPFPKDSPLYSKYPNGYWCKSQECLLNAVYTLADNNKKLFPGDKYPGVTATAGVIEEILGLKINYWAMVDLSGFRHLIDALGGIRLDIGKRVPIGSLNSKKGVYGWIEPGKNVHLDGFNALWFARSREYSSDYERMVRQKCVMNAMVKQLDPVQVITNFNDIAKASGKTVATNLSADQIPTMLTLATLMKDLPMASVSFTPPLIKPVKPDFEKIRAVVADAIAESEAKDEAATAQPSASQPSAPANGSASAKPKPKPSASSSKNRTDDLDDICKVSK